MSARILVGDLVRVARPEGGGPVNHEGHTGRVVDALGDGSACLVAYAGELGRESWVDARYLVTPVPYRMRPIDPERAAVAEPEGHDDHLDAIEAKLYLIARQAARDELWRNMATSARDERHAADHREASILNEMRGA